jgi:hypothetical protein
MIGDRYDRELDPMRARAFASHLWRQGLTGPEILEIARLEHMAKGENWLSLWWAERVQEFSEEIRRIR